MNIDSYKCRYPATGFEWETRPNYCACENVCESMYTPDVKSNLPQSMINNLMKVIGYFPLILGQIAGTFHIHRGWKLIQDPCPYTTASGIGLIARGVLECCCLGWIYIPVDIAKVGIEGAMTFLYRDSSSSDGEESDFRKDESDTDINPSSAWD